VNPSPSAKVDARRVFVFYHYLYPDNVVSALHMDGLCQGLVERGWQVTAFPGNRGCRDENLTYPPIEFHSGVTLRRVWRPRFRQAMSLGRLLNAVWMITAWSLLALRGNAPETIVVGTDPILSVTIAFAWKLLRPRTRVLHWCFDLYPEAAYADNLLSPHGSAARILDALLRRAYALCDQVVVIGPCMLEQIAHYRKPGSSHDPSPIIVPWALEEPPAVLPQPLDERKKLFGDAQLALLYSGNFGRAHTYDDFLALAHHLRSDSAAIAFSVRGNREQELRQATDAIDPSTLCPIHFVPFADPDRLLDRLAAPDIHMLSLAPAWTGTVVPSKFFGALAAGRPVVYSGSPDSSVAKWIERHQVGWLLTSESAASVAADLRAYVNDPQRVHAMQQRCRDTYHTLFSRQASIDHMHALLLELVSSSA
jgi:glycosyltransferase involved in cell wall biosynthesis